MLESLQGNGHMEMKHRERVLARRMLLVRADDRPPVEGEAIRRCVNAIEVANRSYILKQLLVVGGALIVGVAAFVSIQVIGCSSGPYTYAKGCKSHFIGVFLLAAFCSVAACLCTTCWGCIKIAQDRRYDMHAKLYPERLTGNRDLDYSTAQKTALPTDVTEFDKIASFARQHAERQAAQPIDERPR